MFMEFSIKAKAAGAGNTGSPLTRTSYIQGTLAMADNLIPRNKRVFKRIRAFAALQSAASAIEFSFENNIGVRAQ